MIWFSHILSGLGIFSLFYFIVIILYAGIRTAFAFFWVITGLLCLALSYGIHALMKSGINVPKTISYVVIGIFILCVLIFVVLEGNIIFHALQKPKEGADYVIVLGAQVRGTRITRSLKKRLDKAYEYLERNPKTKVIVSGGQGKGEYLSEAEAMKKYLIEKGIKEERIIEEKKSTNTEENIRFSKELVEENSYIVIVTNSFHVYRAVKIAEKQKIGEVGGLAAPSDRVLVLSYYVRECLAVIKDKIFGNMD